MKKTPAVAATPAETPAAPEQRQLSADALLYASRWQQEMRNSEQLTALLAAAQAENAKLVAVVQRASEQIKAAQQKPKAAKLKTVKPTVN